MITRVNINGFSPNLVCALILWRSGLGLLMGKFRQILTELCAQEKPVFSFPDDNVSKCQGILTRVGTCIDIKEIWFGITNGQILPMFDRVTCLRHDNGGVLRGSCKKFCHWVRITSVLRFIKHIFITNLQSIPPFLKHIL